MTEPGTKPPGTKPIADNLIVYALRTVTEAAARAAYEWIGRGDKAQGDAAAVDAMRTALAALPLRGVVVIGEGAKDQAPELADGESHGGGMHVQYDIAVDPVEGTTYLANGMTNAMAVIAMAPHGTLFDPTPVYYMEKFAAPPAAKGRVDPAAPVADKLEMLAKALDKPVRDLCVYVLEKPRHKELVERIHAAGARVALYPAGDVAGAIMAAIPDSGVDALMGTGGTPEGILSACAIRALGGTFYGRLDPQLAGEKAAADRARVDTRTWHAVEDLVRTGTVYFCATGITTGLLFNGVEKTRNHTRTQTLMIAGPGGDRQLLDTCHRHTGDIPT